MNSKFPVNKEHVDYIREKNADDFPYKPHFVLNGVIDILQNIK